MAVVESSRFCRTCERPTLHARSAVGCGGALVHALLSIFTVGLWLPIFVLHVLLTACSAPRCRFCGRTS